MRSVGVLLLSTVGLMSCGVFGHSFYIPSCANYPTLKPGNHITVKEPAGTIHRGDIVVFHPPPGPGGLARPSDVVMRVVGLPGDIIGTRKGVVTINGQVLPEPYLAPATVTASITPQTIPAGEYFVMGDNRSNSLDSRSYGPIPASSIIGRMTGFASKKVDSSAVATCAG
jgi:signal peptidase I